MKKFLLSAIIPLILGGCGTYEPVESKSNFGNLEINIVDPSNADFRQAEIYIDDIFVGNVSPTKPIIFVKRGQRVIRIKANHYKPYEKTITILGEPNHQVLNVSLEPLPQ